MSESAFWLSTYEEHGSSVMAFLTSRTGRRDVAEDLLQETFVRAIRAMPKLPNPSKVRSYLFTTAHHLVISRARRKRPLLFSEVSGDGASPVGEIADRESTSAESLSDLRRLEKRLEEVLQGLTADHSTAFRLAVLQQMPYADIASRQGWSLGRVKTNVHRARKQVILALHDVLGQGLENAS